jgi:hypothetical protein
VRSRKIGWDRTKVGNLSYAEAAGRKADGAGRQEVTVGEGYQCVLENNTKEKGSSLIEEKQQPILINFCGFAKASK